MFPTAKSMNFRNCTDHITDDGLKNLPRTLIKLDLRFCDNITDDGLKNLTQTPVFRKCILIFILLDYYISLETQ